VLTRGEIIFKWTLYAAAAALVLFLQTAVLQRIQIWGVIPFLYPLLPALPATYEDPFAGTLFALSTGVFCDLLLPAPIPCLYTLVFPVIGLFCALMAKNLLPAGFLCSAAAAAISFSLTDLVTCLLLWVRGNCTWSAGLSVAIREFCVSLPWILPFTILLRFVYRRTHLES